MKEHVYSPALPKKRKQAAWCQVASVVITVTMQKQVRAQLVLGRFTYSTWMHIKRATEWSQATIRNLTALLSSIHCPSHEYGWDLLSSMLWGGRASLGAGRADPTQAHSHPGLGRSPYLRPRGWRGIKCRLFLPYFGGRAGACARVCGEEYSLKELLERTEVCLAWGNSLLSLLAVVTLPIPLSLYFPPAAFLLKHSLLLS